MARPTVNILFNLSANDTPCTNPAGDANFVKLDSGDAVVWRDSQQNGGDLLSGVSYPVVIPDTGSKESPKMFLMDQSSGEYEQILLAGTTDGGGGGGDKRYVCAAYFNGQTATIPYLEAYDNNTHTTSLSKPLGDGTPANSCFKAIPTTNASPGSATWAGTPLAGLTSRIALDTAAIAASKCLYWNMKQVLTASMISWPTAEWFNNDLVFTIHFTYS